MTLKQELAIFRLYEGEPLRKLSHALVVTETLTAQRVLELRIKIVGLTVG